MNILVIEDEILYEGRFKKYNQKVCIKYLITQRRIILRMKIQMPFVMSNSN